LQADTAAEVGAGAAEELGERLVLEHAQLRADLRR
jgi:hypothetical protein